MLIYIKKIAERILQKDLRAIYRELEDIRTSSDNLAREKNKLQQKIRRMERPENILLSHYRIDNIGVNGTPPSYLNPQNMNDYTQKIRELESIYRNEAFRELMAWSLNFHANMCASGKIKNEFGDEIEIPTEHAKHMIAGIKSIWDLVVAAHLKDMELTASKTVELSDIMDEPTEEGD